MKEGWNFDRCVWVLNAEIALLKEISKAQDTVRKAAISREWADFDQQLRDVNRYGEEFARLDEERVRLFSALSAEDEGIQSAGGSAAGERNTAGGNSSEKKPFYVALAVLPQEERKELSWLYRELKMETLKMRALNESFLSYLAEAKNAAASYIETVCPARGGKLYTRKGHRVSQDLKSIVINNRF